MKMILYYLPLVVLFGLAISDLIVGVANDAVNFTNSAVGSHVAPRRVILIIASIGILLGITYSGGMLEIARKGVIYPQYFTFDNVITIFLAVMISDVILLDLFNTYGLPTSTSVSFVFELLGGAVAVGMIIMLRSGSDFTLLAQYINSDRALLMILGLFISILLAFLFGLIIQFISRLLLTFRIKKHHRAIGSIWSAFAIAFIFYFILIKGLKGSELLSFQQSAWIQNHIPLFIISFFLVCSVVFLILNIAFKINPLKIVVMMGTFALALAFAANDLVNFIGVPLAGFISYQIAQFDIHSGSLMMQGLGQPFKTPYFMLLFAGIIMILTLWLSKKAKFVTKTEVELARQTKGTELFDSSKIAKIIVDANLSLFNFVKLLLPSSFKIWVSKRYQHKKQFQHKEKDILPAFDLVRASVNLTVASSLISLGTSLKLPLSTTYVTFMVAMGSSIADGAWTADRAPYRVNGVLIVIGGWFLTGLVAFSASFIFAVMINYGGSLIILLLILIAMFSIFRTHKIFLERHKNEL